MKYKFLGILFIILVISAIASFIYYWQALEKASQYFQPVKRADKTPNYKNRLLRLCPAEWIVDEMPEIGKPDLNDPPKEYFIYQGVRRDLSEFDVDWVKVNCDVEPSYAY